MEKNDQYDWLDDPFDEKKAAAEREGAQMGCGAKAALVVVLVIAAFAVFALVALGALAVMLS